MRSLLGRLLRFAPSLRQVGSPLLRHNGVTRTVQPEFLRGEEPLAGYRVGGYHPTTVGETLKERYHIHRKLGWGLTSTVWLAYDKLTDEYCSIKILTGEASPGSERMELEFLRRTSAFDPTHPGYSHIIRLLDHFYHSGPYGNHLCLVTEVLCESVLSLAMRAHYRNVHPVATKTFTLQILQGLDYLHKSGIIHTDLKLDNFLVEVDDMDTHVRRTLESSSPVLCPEVDASDGRKIHYTATTFIPIPYDDYVADREKLNVKIADLGTGCWESRAAEFHSFQIQPPSLRAPEVYVGAGWDSKIDIWTLGLLVLEMFRGSPVIPPIEDTTNVESSVFILVQLFGKFPPDLLEKGKFSARYFKPDGSFLYDMPKRLWSFRPWDSGLRPYERFLHQDELRNLRSFLELALRLRPEERATAAELLAHEWINTETIVINE